MPEDNVAVAEAQTDAAPEVESQLSTNVDTGGLKSTFPQPASGEDYVPPTTEELAVDLDFDDPSVGTEDKAADDVGAQEVPSTGEPSADEPEGEVTEPVAEVPTKEGREPEPQVEPDPFGDDLLVRARLAGVSESRARACGTPENLRRSLAMLEEQATTRQPEPEKIPAVTAESVAYKSQLDPETVDPAVAQELRRMNEHYSRQVAEMKTVQSEGVRQSQQSLEQLQQQQAVAAEQSLKQGTVTWCKGSKAAGDLFKDPANVDRMHRACHMEAHSFRAMRLDVPPIEELRARAFRAEFGGEVEANVRREINNNVVKRDGQRMARPTQRQTKSAVEGSSGESAADNADRIYREAGLSLDSGEVPEDF